MEIGGSVYENGGSVYVYFAERALAERYFGVVRFENGDASSRRYKTRLGFS